MPKPARSRIMGISAHTADARNQNAVSEAATPVCRAVRYRPIAGLVRVVPVSVSVVAVVSVVQVLRMVEIECHNCGHTWQYGGQREPGELVTCPRCYYKTRYSAETETSETEA